MYATKKADALPAGARPRRRHVSEHAVAVLNACRSSVAEDGR